MEFYTDDEADENFYQAVTAVADSAPPEHQPPVLVVDEFDEESAQQLIHRVSVPPTPTTSTPLLYPKRDRCSTFFLYSSFVFGIILMSALGTVYAYSTYSQLMKRNLNLTQTETNLIPSIASIPSYIGSVVGGSLYDKGGPIPTLILSAALMFGGNFLLYLVNTHTIPKNLFFLAMFYSMGQIGSVAGYYASLNTNLKNFDKKHRGKITGVLVCCYGISAAILTQIYHWFFEGATEFITDTHSPLLKPIYVLGDVVSFLLFLAIYLGCIPIPGLILLRTIKQRTEVAVNTSASVQASDYKQVSSTRLVPDEAKYPQKNRFAVLINPDYLLLGFIKFFGSGAGQLFIGVVGSIIQSWRITDIDHTTYVTLLSIGNAAGRLLMGFCLDHFRTKIRAVALFIPCFATAALAHGVLVFYQNSIVLLIATIITGLTYGGVMAIFPYTTFTYFGASRFGFTYSSLAVFTSSASVGLSTISGRLYDAWANPTPSGDRVCYGVMCYIYTLTITCCFLIIATWLAIWLLARERRYDRKMKHKRFSFNN